MLIYKITNRINYLIYIGQTTQSLIDRWSGHCQDAKYNLSQTPLHRAMRKNGIVNFTIEEIELGTIQSKEELDFLEILLIVVLKSCDPIFGYNLKEGGSHGKHTQQTKDLISTILLNDPIINAKIGAAHRGISPSAHTRELLRLANIGKITPQHIREKISRSCSKPRNIESKNKGKNYEEIYGKERAAEIIAKQQKPRNEVGNKRKPKTPAHIENMRKAHRLCRAKIKYPWLKIEKYPRMIYVNRKGEAVLPFLGNFLLR